MGAVTEILTAVGTSFAAAELCAHVGIVGRWLIKRAAHRLPESERERSQEEWLADLNDMPSALQKLGWALGCHWAATVANVRAWRASENAAVKSRAAELASKKLTREEQTLFGILILAWIVAAMRENTSSRKVRPEGLSGGLRVQLTRDRFVWIATAMTVVALAALAVRPTAAAAAARALGFGLKHFLGF